MDQGCVGGYHLDVGALGCGAVGPSVVPAEVALGEDLLHEAGIHSL